MARIRLTAEHKAWQATLPMAGTMPALHLYPPPVRRIHLPFVDRQVMCTLTRDTMVDTAWRPTLNRRRAKG